jgi:ABC-type multidrug transport system permease subunit
MRTAWIIALNDVRLHLRTRIAFLWMFLVPLVFTYFMGFANRGPGEPSNPKPAVLIENVDPGFLGRQFVAELEAQGLWRIDPTNRSSARRSIQIPADLTERALRGESTGIMFSKLEGDDDPGSAMIELRYYRALIAINARIVESALKHDGTAVLTEASLDALRDLPSPVRLEARFAGRKPTPTGFKFSLPGNLVMYLMMNLLIFGGATVAWERRAGMMRRLLTLPIAKHQLLLGKLLGLMMLGSVQIIFMGIAGWGLFGVRFGANLPAILLTLILFAWVAASLGMLIGSWITAEDRVVGISVLSSIVMAAVGGCWWPLEVASPAMQQLALCIPTGWAMKAMHTLISFGGNLGDVLTELAVLAAFGIVANILAIRFFRAA